MKNCDRRLENAALGVRPRAAFSSSRSQFFTIRTDPKPVNNVFIFFPAVNWLTSLFAYPTLSLNIWLKVIPEYCIAHPYCARFSRH